MMEIEACRVLPGQMVQTISVDVGDATAVEKAMDEAVAKQGAVQVILGSWLSPCTLFCVGFCRVFMKTPTSRVRIHTYFHALLRNLSVVNVPTQHK